LKLITHCLLVDTHTHRVPLYSDVHSFIIFLYTYVWIIIHMQIKALHKAAVKGQLETCKWLIETGGLGLPQMQPDSDGNGGCGFTICVSMIIILLFTTSQQNTFLK
jgi:hypothetical protein